MGRVFVCHGKDCRKSKGFGDLCRAVGDAEAVACQKVCKGPVAGVVIDDRFEWFAKLRTGKLHQALVRAAETGEIGKKLKARRVKKRSGRFRGLSRLLAAK